MEFGERKVNVSDRQIRIDGLNISPAEAGKITGLLGIAGKMGNLKALPPEIGDPPFSIMFKEDGNHCLVREFTSQEIFFTFDNIDETIQTINKCLDMSLDIQKLAPSTPPRGGPIGPEPGDIIEGRG